LAQFAYNVNPACQFNMFPCCSINFIVTNHSFDPHFTTDISQSPFTVHHASTDILNQYMQW